MNAGRPPSHRTLKFHTERFDEMVAPRGLTSEVQKAKFLGVDKAHYHRVANHKAKPGPAFVGAVLAALPGVSFDHLFQVVEVTS